MPTPMVSPLTRPTRRRAVDRLAAAFILVVLALGCLVLFIGIPAGYLWALSKVTSSSTTHVVAGILGIPVAMALFAPALFWINGLYLRVTGAAHDEDLDELEEEQHLRSRGPLEPMLVAAFVIAVIAFTVWFFFYARNPELGVF